MENHHTVGFRAWGLYGLGLGLLGGLCARDDDTGPNQTKQLQHVRVLPGDGKEIQLSVRQDLRLPSFNEQQLHYLCSGSSDKEESHNG